MRGIIFLAGIAMAASWVLTWIEPPFAGPELSPMALAREGVIVLGADATWQTWVFVGGFGAAALAALVSVFGRGAGLVALLAGLSPIVVGVDAWLRADEFVSDWNLPVPVDVSNLGQTWEVLQDFVRAGLYAYLGGAALLLLVGISTLFAGRR